MAEPISTLTLIGVGTVKAAELFGISFVLGLGFWASKQLTNKIDWFIYKQSRNTP